MKIMYLQSGRKSGGLYVACYMRARETITIRNSLYFNDPLDAVCWIMRKFYQIQPHCWEGAEIYKTGTNECVFEITSTRIIIEHKCVQDLHAEYLKLKIR